MNRREWFAAVTAVGAAPVCEQPKPRLSIDVFWGTTLGSTYEVSASCSRYPGTRSYHIDWRTRTMRVYTDGALGHIVRT